MVESKIVPIEESDEYVNLLVYGRSGVGKTVLAGSADGVLFLAPEDDGVISARRHGSKADKWPIKHWNDLGEAYDYITENVEEIQDKYRWISIDSATHMQRILMRAILEEAVEENSLRDPDIPAIQDWQKYQNMFLRFVQQFNELPINVLWTALVRSEEDEEGNGFLTPDIQGKGYQMAQTVASFMTCYGYMQAKKIPRKDKEGKVMKNAEGVTLKKTVRIITWEDTGPIQGKDRTGVLAPITVNKTLQEISDMIQGSK